MSVQPIRWWQVVLLWLGVLILSGAIVNSVRGVAASGAGGIGAVTVPLWPGLLLLLLILAAVVITILWFRGRGGHV